MLLPRFRDHPAGRAMNRSTRRSFGKSAAAIAGGHCILGSSRGVEILTATMKKSDARVERIACSYEEHVFRAPLKFALTVMNRATLLTVRCTVRTRTGKVATGFGTMPLNYAFCFPSSKLSEQTRLGAMRALADEIAKITRTYTETGHPIDINWELAPLYLKAAADVSRRLQLADPIPKLCTLVTAAAFDAAIHDAYGKAHNINCFHTYGPEFMNHDLSHYLGAEYRGEYPSGYIRSAPRARMPLCHLISAVDPIEAADNAKPIRDGLPETLPEWIHFNGLKYFKIKLNGNDLKWDLERVLHIDRVITETLKQQGKHDWAYVLDFNEKCPDVDYYLKFLGRLRATLPDGFERVEYVEQPTARDLEAHPENAMHAAARLCPVVIDESLTDVASLLLARRLGWTGAVVKSPKGLTHMLMVASVAGKQKIFLAGGDMSCPGAALIQTACLQARVPGLSSVEANARQFLPAANRAWEARFPGMFRITDGMIRTGELTQPGLGA
jgi:L-alanine-DL-glutamate epimerase-like enolase superfamily enzyme